MRFSLVCSFFPISQNRKNDGSTSFIESVPDQMGEQAPGLESLIRSSSSFTILLGFREKRVDLKNIGFFHSSLSYYFFVDFSSRFPLELVPPLSSLRQATETLEQAG
jgi:hypothetical protein